MHRCLYMICPSDYLEPVINSRFKGHNYFYTSLGNTVVSDEDTLGQIAAIIEENSIQEITFVLSEDNNFVFDALNHQNFIEIRGLMDAYNHSY